MVMYYMKKILLLIIVTLQFFSGCTAAERRQDGKAVARVLVKVAETELDAYIRENWNK